MKKFPFVVLLLSLVAGASAALIVASLKFKPLTEFLHVLNSAWVQMAAVIVSLITLAANFLASKRALGELSLAVAKTTSSYEQFRALTAAISRLIRSITLLVRAFSSICSKGARHKIAPPSWLVKAFTRAREASFDDSLNELHVANAELLTSEDFIRQFPDRACRTREAEAQLRSARRKLIVQSIWPMAIDIFKSVLGRSVPNLSGRP